ncbi:DUF3526 domain-containing protein, partial [bacterium]
YRTPEVLSTLVQGVDRKLGTNVEIVPYEMPVRASGYMGQGMSQQHRLVAGLSTVDMTCIIRIILSLLVIFLAYDSISGERAAGTLRVILSNPVPRRVILLGKSLGGMSLILAATIVAMLASLVLLAFHPMLVLGSDEVLRFLGMVGISALYLLFFFSLSLFVSVVADRPSTGLLWLLLIWLFVVILYPNLAVIIASNTSQPPDERAIQQQKKAAAEPYEAEKKQLENALSAALNNAQDEPLRNHLRRLELDELQARAAHQVDVAVSNTKGQQARLAQALAVLSPAALFDGAMTRLARTAPNSYEKFMESVARYWDEYVALSIAKVKNPDRAAARAQSMPAFACARESVAESAVATIPAAAILFAVSTILFMATVVRFTSKDVR